MGDRISREFPSEELTEKIRLVAVESNRRFAASLSESEKKAGVIEMLDLYSDLKKVVNRELVHSWMSSLFCMNAKRVSYVGETLMQVTEGGRFVKDFEKELFNLFDFSRVAIEAKELVQDIIFELIKTTKTFQTKGEFFELKVENEDLYISINYSITVPPLLPLERGCK